MLIKILRVIILIVTIFQLAPLYTYCESDLKRYITMIALNYPDKVKRLLYSIKKTFDEQNNPNFKKVSIIIDNKIKDYVWINGFIVEDKNGNKFVISHGDFINEINRVSLIFTINKKIYEVKNVPVVYVDINTLISIIPLPKGIEKYTKSFSIDTKKYKSTTPIVLAGYLHDGIKPVWKVFNEVQISGGSYDMDLPGEGNLLVHSLKEKLSEDGIPVIIKNNKQDMYSVIGMNPIKNYTIPDIATAYPSHMISEVIDKYKESVKIQNDPELLEKALRENINLFQYAVNSNINEDSRFRILTHLISYEYTFNDGFDMILSKLKTVKNDSEQKIIMYLSIIPTMEIKNLIINQIFEEIKYDNYNRVFSFDRLKLKEKLSYKIKVDSIFKLTNREVIFSWIFEQGIWKIGDIKFTHNHRINL